MHQTPPDMLQTPPDTTRHAPDNVRYVCSGSVMIYIAVQLIQIFSAGGRADRQTDRGGTRGPRGPKNMNHKKAK